MDQRSSPPLLQLGPPRTAKPSRSGSQVLERSPKGRDHEATVPTPAGVSSSTSSRRGGTAYTTTPVWMHPGLPKSGSPTGRDSTRARFTRAPAPARVRRSPSPSGHAGASAPSRWSLVPQPSFTPLSRSRASTPMLTAGATVRVRSPGASGLAPTSPTSGGALGSAVTSQTSGFSTGPAPTSPTSGGALGPAVTSQTSGVATSPAPTSPTNGFASGLAKRPAPLMTSSLGPAPSWEPALVNADTPSNPFQDSQSPDVATIDLATGTSSIVVSSLKMPSNPLPQQAVSSLKLPSNPLPQKAMSSTSPRQTPFDRRRSCTPLVSSSPMADTARRPAYPIPAPQGEQSPSRRSAYPIPAPQGQRSPSSRPAYPIPASQVQQSPSRRTAYPILAPHGQQSPRRSAYPIPTPPLPLQHSPRSPTSSPMSSRGASVMSSSASTAGPWQRAGTAMKAVQAFAQSTTMPAQPPQVTCLDESTTGPWQRASTVMKAVQAFAQSATMPAQPPQVTQAAHSWFKWPRMSNGAQATLASAPPTQANGTLQMGLPSTTKRSGGSVHLAMPASRPTTSTFSSVSRSAVRSSTLSPSARPQQNGLPISPYLTSRPSSVSSVYPSQVPQVTPRPEEFPGPQPKLATIETGKVLTTDTIDGIDKDGTVTLSTASAIAASAPASARRSDHDQASVEGAGQSRDFDQDSNTSTELPPHVLETLRSINEMLQDRQRLKATVIKNFKQARQEEQARNSESRVTFVEDDQIENATLGKMEFYVFVDLLSKAVDLPPYAFGNLELEYVCFDFNGHGTLNINETYKFVKFHLKEYRRELGAGGQHHVSVDIPVKTLAEAGYEILEVLGHGNQGFAKLARDTTGNELCLKVFDKKKMRNEEFLDMVEEFEAMQLLSCSCIAGASEMFQDSLNYYMACELYRGGDFTQLTENALKQDVDMDEDWYCDLFRQCFEAIKFMHEQAVMHCDIKEPNLMLKTSDFSNPEVVVIDLGVSNSLVQSIDEGIPYGTPGYVPPETLETMKWFPPGDIFSMGVVVFQIVTGLTPPERGLFIDGCKNAKEMFKATLEREPDYSMVPAEMPGLRDLLEQILEKDKDQRPRPTKVLKHYWFSGADVSENNSDQSAELTKNIREFYKRIAPKHHFATLGFTNSMIQHIQDRDEEDEDEDASPQSPES